MKSERGEAVTIILIMSFLCTVLAGATIYEYQRAREQTRMPIGLDRKGASVYVPEDSWRITPEEKKDI